MVHIVDMEPAGGVKALSTEELRAEVERLKSLIAAEAQAKAVGSGPTSQRDEDDNQAAGLELEEEEHWCVAAHDDTTRQCCDWTSQLTRSPGREASALQPCSTTR